jgi:hypothetical protein
MSDITTLMMGAAGAGGGGAETDPNFNQTVLLLHGDGTNGAQNNTFLDSSSNTFTITRAGNTTQGTFSPFSVAEGAFSNYFDGSGDYFTTVSANTANAMGAGDWTVEAWVYRTSSASDSFVFDTLPAGSGAVVALRVIIDSSSKLVLKHYGAAVLTSTGTVPLNTWTHIAIVKNSGTTTAYINGVADGTYADSSTYTCGASRPVIGGDGYGLGAPAFPGYISNLRAVKGRAVYTSSFTPPTAPLGATSGGDDPPQGTETTLLVCQTNRFKDNSTNNFALTVAGNTSVQPFSPFAPSAAYSPSVNGGSGYFDGSGDDLTVATAAALQFGTGDLTVEFWLYPQTSGRQDWFEMPGTNRVQFLYEGTNVAVYVNSGLVVGGAVTPVLNQWNHYAWTRSGGTNRVYQNGVQVGSDVTNTTNFTDNSVVIGYTSGGNYTKGYFANVRILKGTALYTSAFTPPTAPADPTGSSLCLLAQNAGIFDNTGKNVLETVGNCAINTTTKKYGTGSMSFDGSGDYLVAPSTPDTILSGDFTIEGWVYRASSGSYRFFTVGDSSGATGIEVYVSGTPTGNWIVYSNSATRITGATATREVWTHLAVVRSGSTVTFYVNGSASGSTWSSSATFSGRVFVGAEFFSGSVTADTNGYIDDFRISRVARYLTTFTPPDAPFPDQ